MEPLAEKHLVAEMLDVYGELLTERQRDFIDLYYNEDFSFGEIAETENISRQAVHDAIQHGKKTLFRFEKHLNLVKERHQSNQVTLAPQQSLSTGLEELYEMVRNEDIVYDTLPLQNKIKSLLKLCKERSGATG